MAFIISYKNSVDEICIHDYAPEKKEEALGVGNELVRDKVASFFRIDRLNDPKHIEAVLHPTTAHLGSTRLASLMSLVDTEAPAQGNGSLSHEEYLRSRLVHAAKKEATHGKCDNCLQQKPIKNLVPKKGLLGIPFGEFCVGCLEDMAIRRNEAIAREERLKAFEKSLPKNDGSW